MLTYITIALAAGSGLLIATAVNGRSAPRLIRAAATMLGTVGLGYATYFGHHLNMQPGVLGPDVVIVETPRPTIHIEPSMWCVTVSCDRLVTPRPEPLPTPASEVRLGDSLTIGAGS